MRNRQIKSGINIGTGGGRNRQREGRRSVGDDKRWKKIIMASISKRYARLNYLSILDPRIPFIYIFLLL